MQISLSEYTAYVPASADDQFEGRWSLEPRPDAAWVERFRQNLGSRFEAAVLNVDAIELRAGWEQQAADRMVREAVRLANGGN